MASHAWLSSRGGNGLTAKGLKVLALTAALALALFAYFVYYV